MKILKFKNYKEMSEKAAELIIKEIKRKPNLVLGFATGKTPIGMYKELVKDYRNGKVDFSKVKTFNLDEYYPISKKDRKSYFYYMHKNLFDKINIKKENINLLNGETKNWRKECLDYEAKIKRNPIDLQILGIGVNGHIAFDEPPAKANSVTRLVELTLETKKINKTNKKALTMGISTIMKSRKIILLASGKKKAEAIKCLMKYKPNRCCPASLLKKHKDFIVIVDKGAGSLI
jgi:glucosamine-6-phosphate deaminase